MQPQVRFERSATTAEEQRALYGEQVKQLYGNAVVGLLATSINSLVLAVIQRDVTSHATLIAWVALLTVINLLRYRDIRTFRRKSPEASEANRWCWRFTVGLALSGMAWGSSAIFLFPSESLGHQTFLAFVIGGMVAGAAAAFSSVMKAFLAYSVPALSPIIVRFALLGDEFHLAMAGMALLFGVMIFYIAVRINTVWVRSVKLRFEKSNLVSYLTERKRMEEALRESEDKYRTLVEQSLQGTWVIQDMRVVFCNQTFANMGGWTIPEVLSWSPEEVTNIIHPDDHKRVWGRFREGLEGNQLPLTNNQVRAFRKDGSIAWIEYDARRINFIDRPAMLISVLDITERKQAEEALHERDAQLERLNKELEAFSYSVSHDLRTPLIGISGLSGILLEKYSKNLAEKGQQYLRLMQQEAQNMLQLIDDLMAFSRFERQEIKHAPIDMSELAKTVYEGLKSTMPEQGMSVDIKPLPPVRGDHAMIRQVFYNLLSNAIKFTKPKEAGMIEIGCLTGEDVPIYYVKDNGIGFDMQHASKLFEVFQRLHSADKFEGTGVGLAIVQRIVQRHGGRVWAEGKVNEGATFYFTLPRGEERIAP